MSKKRFCPNWGAALWVLSLLILVGPETYALDPAKSPDHYLYQAWTSREDFPQNAATAITQTRDGYLWIGTQVGLVRFNGNTFTVFTPEDTDGLSHVNIVTLFEDNDGVLWIGTEGGLSKYADGKFNLVGVKEGLVDIQINSIAQDGKGRLWIGTVQKDLWAVDGDSVKMVAVDPDQPNLWIHAVHYSEKHSLWVGTAGGAYRLNEKSGQFDWFTNANGLPSLEVTAFAEDAKGVLWAGTSTGVAKQTSEGFVVPDALRALAEQQINKMIVDTDGNWWYATIQNGLWRYAPSTKTVNRIGNLLAPEKGIHAVYEDREKNIWVGTSTTGLVQIRDPKLVTIAPNAFPLSSMTWSLMRDSKGNIWQGTASGVLRHNVDGSISRFAGQLNAPVLAMYETPTGEIWIGYEGSGPAKFTPKGFEFLSATIPEMANRRVRAFYQDADGNLFVGTRTKGLFIVKDNKIVSHIHRNNGLKDNSVVGMGRLKDGRLIINTTVGSLEYKDGNFIEDWAGEGLSHIRLYGPVEDEDGRIWFGSIKAGLFVIEGDKITNIKMKQGLLENSIFTFLDHEGSYWMSGNKGIYRVTKSDMLDVVKGSKNRFQTEFFGSATGLQTEECNGGAQENVLKTPSGQLWFSCVDGAVIIDPRRLQGNELAPTIVLENVLANHNPIGENHVLSHKDRRLDFHYAALTYVASKDAQIKYKLEGFDSDWIESGPVWSVHYTNLPPGEYTFRVIAANSDGVWNDEGASYSFIIEKPFYLETWFFAIAAVLLVLIVVVITRFGHGKAAPHKMVHGIAPTVKLELLGLVGQIAKTNQTIKQVLNSTPQEAQTEQTAILSKQSDTLQGHTKKLQEAVQNLNPMSSDN